LNVKTRAHVFISGYVQGVFFRETAKNRADSLNVMGWVRNREDGGVEAVFEGEEQDVKKTVEYCKHGPPRAAVTHVEVLWENCVGEFDGFEIRF
jgi:acylphosphatase